MALNANAVFTAAKGYVYVADVADAVAPTPAEIKVFNAADGLGTGWRDVGHTSREELPEFGFDGGETETRGTWQNAALRTVVPEAAVDYVVVQLHQFDDEALELYYGVPNASEDPGQFSVAEASTQAPERALCIVIEDGENHMALYAPRVSAAREDSITMAVDEFAALPIRFTFLKRDPDQDGTTYPLFTWINEDVLGQTVGS